MLTKYNEYLEPTYLLSTSETEELEKYGYVLLDNETKVVVRNLDGCYMVFNLNDEYEGLILNSKEADKEEEENAK